MELETCQRKFNAKNSAQMIEIERLKDKLSVATTSKVQTSETNKKLLDDLAEARKSFIECEKKFSERKDADAKLVIKANRECEENKIECANAKRNVADLKEKLSTLQSKFDQTYEEFSRFKRTSYSDNNASQKEIKSLKDSLSMTTQELESALEKHKANERLLKSNKQQYESELANKEMQSRTRMEELTQTRSEYQKYMEDCKIEMERLAEEKNKEARNVVKRKEEYNELSARNDELKSELDQLIIKSGEDQKSQNSEMQQMRNKIESLKRTSRDRELQLYASVGEQTRIGVALSNEVEKLKRISNSREEQVNSLLEKKAKDEAEWRKYTTENIEQQSELEAKFEEFKQKKNKELVSLMQERNALKSDIDRSFLYEKKLWKDFKNKQSEFGDKLCEKESAINDLKVKFERSESRNQQLQKDIDTCNAALKECRDEMEEKNSKLNLQLRECKNSEKKKCQELETIHQSDLCKIKEMQKSQEAMETRFQIQRESLQQACDSEHRKYVEDEEIIKTLRTSSRNTECKLEAELKEQKEKSEELLREITRLRSLQKEMTTKCTKSEGDCQSKEIECCQQKKEIESLKNEVTELCALNKDLVGTCQKSKDKYFLEVTKLQEDMAECRNKSTEEHNVDLKQIKNLENKNLELKICAEKVNEEKCKLENECALARLQMEQEKQKCEREVVAKEEKCQKVIAREKAMNIEFAEVKSKFQAHVAWLEAKIADLKETIKKDEELIEQEHRTAIIAQRDAEITKKTLAANIDELKKLTAELDIEMKAQKAENARISKEYEDCKEKLRTTEKKLFEISDIVTE